MFGESQAARYFFLKRVLTEKEDRKDFGIRLNIGKYHYIILSAISVILFYFMV